LDRNPQAPFHETIFLDDHSPNQCATHLLEKCGLKAVSTRIEYQKEPHPAHSNFGIVAAFSLAQTPFIMRLDDDAHVISDQDECKARISQTLEVLRADPSILGANLLTLKPGKDGEEWMPGKNTHANSATRTQESTTGQRRRSSVGNCLIASRSSKSFPGEATSPQIGKNS
jgi:hypothetical protein